MTITRKGERGKKMTNTIQINDIALKLDYELKTEKLFKEDGPFSDLLKPELREQATMTIIKDGREIETQSYYAYTVTDIFEIINKDGVLRIKGIDVVINPEDVDRYNKWLAEVKAAGTTEDAKTIAQETLARRREKEAELERTPEQIERDKRYLEWTCRDCELYRRVEDDEAKMLDSEYRSMITGHRVRMIYVYIIGESLSIFPQRFEGTPKENKPEVWTAEERDCADWLRNSYL